MGANINSRERRFIRLCSDRLTGIQRQSRMFWLSYSGNKLNYFTKRHLQKGYYYFIFSYIAKYKYMRFEI